MKYYLEVQSEEHYLNPFEIACLYKIYSNKNQPHNRFVARLLTEYCESHNITAKYYYQTKQGMMRVYPAVIYQPIMEMLVESSEVNVEMSMKFDNKTHYFIIKREME